MKVQAEVWWKTLFWVCAIFLLAASGLQATPVAICATTGTYAQLEKYNATGGCQIDGVVFSHFSLTDTTSGSGSIAPSASGVDYNAIVTPGPNGQVGFLFDDFALDVLKPGTSGTATLKLGYWIDAMGPNEYIVNGGLSGAVATPNTTGKNSSSTSISETFTPPGGVTCTSAVTPKNPKTCTFTVPGTQPMDYIYFNEGATPQGIPPTQVLKVAKTLTVTAKGQGFASISDFSNVINVTGAVPEPGFYGLLAGGLAGIFLLAKRRKTTA
jgi:hypothetical protein